MRSGNTRERLGCQGIKELGAGFPLACGNVGFGLLDFGELVGLGGEVLFHTGHTLFDHFFFEFEGLFQHYVLDVRHERLDLFDQFFLAVILWQRGLRAQVSDFFELAFRYEESQVFVQEIFPQRGLKLI